ncbi:MAG: rubredoxin-like domain-containing protein [Haloarculaceae archaeon]
MSDTDDTGEVIDVGLGQAVYDDEGNQLGTVRGFDEHGFYVTTDEGIEALSAEHVNTGVAGEAELMWRCWSCGEMGDIDAVPDGCPSCGAPREDIYYWIDD